MPAYSALSAEDKAILDDFLNLARAWAGEQARANNHAGALDTQYNAQVSAILADITPGSEEIPNAGGLSGAGPMTKDEVVTLVSHMQNILTNMSTHTSGFNTTALRQVWAKAAGTTNLIG